MTARTPLIKIYRKPKSSFKNDLSGFKYPFRPPRHQQSMSAAWIPVNLTCHPSLSFIVLETFKVNIRTQLMNVNICWSVNTSVSMGSIPLENVTDEFIVIYPSISRKSCTSSFDGLGDWGKWLYCCCIVGCKQNHFLFPSGFFHHVFRWSPSDATIQ